MPYGPAGLGMTNPATGLCLPTPRSKSPKLTITKNQANLAHFIPLQASGALQFNIEKIGEGTRLTPF